MVPPARPQGPPLENHEESCHDPSLLWNYPRCPGMLCHGRFCHMYVMSHIWVPIGAPAEGVNCFLHVQLPCQCKHIVGMAPAYCGATPTAVAA